MKLWMLFGYVVVAMAHAGANEKLIVLKSGGHIALSTRGATAFRVRLLADKYAPVDTPLVAPVEADASFTPTPDGDGIRSAKGSLMVTSDDKLVLLDEAGDVITTSTPLSVNATSITLSTNTGKLFGRGASPFDALQLNTDKVAPQVFNRATYAPHYYSTDGYAALGVASQTDGQWFPANYSTDGKQLCWTFGAGAFDLHLMPASSLALGTEAYYGLIGAPAVLPRYAFGFAASRWGWQDRQYIESTLDRFRSGNFPVDSFIVDFEWFTPENDYAYEPIGKPTYNDFGFNPVTFPEPQTQLASYRAEKHVRMAGIRKPRLGNSGNLEMARAEGWILPNGEPGGAYPPDFAGSYAKMRNLDYSQQAVRDWYAKNLSPLYDAGVEFWWNDEGETDYFTFYWWNVAQVQALQMSDKERRFFSLNRAFSPGMARLGAAVWTGDLMATWEDLRQQPGMMLNWALAGAPYVACDIGGFNGDTTATLLTRWYQVGIFMPIMRVHSVLQTTPHFPWLWGDDAANAMRVALETRYRLVPYHYSLAHALYQTQKPWMRPLAMEFPQDADAAGITTEWMDGDILVAPVLREDSQREIYLPAGTWYSLMASTTQTAAVVLQGPSTWGGTARFDEVPAFVRAGSIIVLAPVIQYTDALPGGPLEVQVYAGANCTFDLVEDDGETTAYKAGQVRVTHFSWDDGAKRLSWQVSGNTTAPGPQAFTQLSLTLVGATEISHSGTRSIGDGGFISITRSKQWVPQREGLVTDAASDVSLPPPSHLPPQDASRVDVPQQTVV